MMDRVDEFPEYGHDLSFRERIILIDLVGKRYLNAFNIKVEDHCYYTSHNGMYFNVFDDFNQLKDYLLSSRLMLIKPKEYLDLMELLRNSKLDPSFDNNALIKWASYYGHIELVKHLLNDTRVDPSSGENKAIEWASYNRFIEIVKLLLNDPRVKSKLTESQVSNYTNEIYYSTLISWGRKYPK